MTKPRLLDLFCGAGGAAMGYHRAGFEVVGVDINPQPNYPFDFIQADVFSFLEGETFDMIDPAVVHASPPCQDHSSTAALWQEQRHGTDWMLTEILERFAEIGLPWVVENVGGARNVMGGSWVQLCGSSFGLGVIRHRLFATSFGMLVPSCQHDLVTAPLYVYGHSEDAGTRDRYERAYGVRPGRKEQGNAMGIDWMSTAELTQAIPPAYTEWIGNHLLTVAVTSE